MNNCPACGHQLAEGSRFCGNCGHVIQQTAPDQPAQPQQPSPPQPVRPASPGWPQQPVQQPPPVHQPSPAHPTANEPIERIHCQWCQAMNEKTAVSCRACGAPLDIKNLVSESGWREAPRIKDMTEIRFSQSTCQ